MAKEIIMGILGVESEFAATKGVTTHLTRISL